MRLFTKQELLDYINSGNHSQEIKDAFTTMSDEEISGWLRRAKTTERLEVMIRFKF